MIPPDLNDCHSLVVYLGAPYNAPPVANSQKVEVVVNSFRNFTLTGSDPEGSNLT